MRFVVLGDSYTIGTSVPEDERWPNQLAARIPGLDLVANLAVDGATSADLVAQQLPELERLRPELVGVLIGVNDVVQRIPDGEYAANLAIVLEELLERLPVTRILCIATPDYTVTPRGADFGDPTQQSDAVLRFNAILREECEHRGVRFVPEVFEISREASQDRSLVASDGLHPSGAQYARWVDEIGPAVEAMLAS